MWRYFVYRVTSPWMDSALFAREENRITSFQTFLTLEKWTKSSRIQNHVDFFYFSIILVLKKRRHYSNNIVDDGINSINIRFYFVNGFVILFDAFRAVDCLAFLTLFKIPFRCTAMDDVWHMAFVVEYLQYLSASFIYRVRYDFRALHVSL